MAAAPILYSETRVSPTPAAPSSILHINAAGNSTFGAGRKRPFDEISGVDEDSFERKHLAKEGSVFFRSKSRVPRSFLWRILNDRQVLEVQCVDLVLEQKHAKADSWLTFHISFGSKIIPGGVALADVEERDALEIFVITANNDLHTINLRRDLLTRNTVPADFDAATCVKRYAPSAFSGKHPYRFVAFSNRELFVSLHDGSMLKLSRENNESGSSWRETHFSEGGWSGTLKRQLPLYRPRTVRYGNVDLFDDAIAAIAKSPDGKFIWTVGLDHVLKAWNAETGKVAAQSNLVEDISVEDERKKQGRYMMGPEQKALLQIIQPTAATGHGAVSRGDDLGTYYMVAHSPKDHRFVFYRVATDHSSIDGDSIRFEDAHPDLKLIPPIDRLLSAPIWHLEHFCVKARPNWRDSQLWLRAHSSSGPVAKTFVLNFDLFGGEAAIDLNEVFEKDWATVDSSYLTIEQLKSSADFDALSADTNSEATTSEKWLQFLFYPGRFSESSLETALYIYRKGRRLPATSGKSLVAQPLKQRLVDAISAKIILRRLPSNDQPDYDRYKNDIQTQWSTFFTVLSHWHSQRHSSIGFAFDLEDSLAWTVCADFVAPARANCAFELQALNAELLVSGDASEQTSALSDRIWPGGEDLTNSQFLAVAQQFRGYFPAAPQDKLRSAAVHHALVPSAESSEEELEAIYASCGLQDSITDADYDSLNDAAEAFGGLGNITDQDFLTVVEEFDGPKIHGRDHGETLARYGQRVTIAIVQETIERAQSVLLDLLALVAFLHCDLEQGELHEELRPKEVYEAIMLRLRGTELRLWLLRNASQYGQESETLTLYEHIFAGDWDGSREEGAVLPTLLTAWSRLWALNLSLDQHWDAITSLILGHLIRHSQFDLAQDFTRFLASDVPWISYLKGRLYLATGDHALASISFKEAASEMASSVPSDGNFLNDDERNYFGRGGAAGAMFYFQHISSLFEKLKNFGHTADFAALALDQIDGDRLDQQLKLIDHKKSIQDSPLPKKVENMGEEIAILRIKEATTDLWNRLFNARVQNGHFALAYDVLRHIQEPALQKSNLRTLLQTCVKRDDVSSLLGLPITGDLVPETDKILLSLAKRSMTAGLPSGPKYHEILFAFRTQHSNFRGAAAILYEHLERLRLANKMAIPDPEDETLIQIYVLLINTLACCGDDAWLLAEPLNEVHSTHRKRRLVTLDDIRREYTAELDRRSDILQGRFPLFGGADEMDML